MYNAQNMLNYNVTVEDNGRFRVGCFCIYGKNHDKYC